MHYYVTDETKQTVTLDVSPVQRTEYSENAEWKLNDVTSGVISYRTSNIAKITFNIERRSKFAVYTIIIPVTTLTIINVASFLMPIESGEKAGLSMTAFLTYAFFIIISRDALPHNAIKISYYVIYLCCALMMSVINVVYVIIESKIYHTFGHKPFTFGKNLLRRIRVRKVDVERTKANKKEGKKRTDDSVSKHQALTWVEFLRITDLIAFVISLLYVCIFHIVYSVGVLSS